MICNKILGKVTKFGEKRTKTLGVANRFMVGGGGAQCAPPWAFYPNPGVACEMQITAVIGELEVVSSRSTCRCVLRLNCELLVTTVRLVANTCIYFSKFYL